MLGELGRTTICRQVRDFNFGAGKASAEAKNSVVENKVVLFFSIDNLYSRSGEYEKGCRWCGERNTIAVCRRDL